MEHKKGKLTVIYGCMFSGKTTKMIEEISQRNLKPHQLIVLKPSTDNRHTPTSIVSHNGQTFPCIPYEQDLDIFTLITPYTELISFDETQFFDKMFLFDIKKILGKGIDIVATGLNLDYRGRPFGLINSLIDIADLPIHLKAQCEVCNNPAEYSYRKTNNNVLFLIGGKEHYEPRCKECFENKSLSPN